MQMICHGLGVTGATAEGGAAWRGGGGGPPGGHHDTLRAPLSGSDDSLRCSDWGDVYRKLQHT